MDNNIIQSSLSVLKDCPDQECQAERENYQEQTRLYQNIFSSPEKYICVYPRIFCNRSLESYFWRHFCDLSKSEQRLSLVLIMIAVIFILSSLPRIIIMMYDVIIIDTIRSKSTRRSILGSVCLMK